MEIQTEKEPLVKTAVVKEAVFTFDEVEALACSYFEESEEQASASITFENGILTLTTIEFKDSEVKVYRAPEKQDLYDKMDAKYINILENETSGNDFWDRWSAIIHVLSDFMIVDTILNP